MSRRSEQQPVECSAGWRPRWLVFCLPVALLAAGCGRTELLVPRPPLPVRPELPLDAVDLEPDAGVDAGQPDAGPLDAGLPCAVIVHSVSAAGHRPIDVLFVVDNSCSMEDDQRSLASNSSSFFSTFSANQADYQLGAISTDEGSGGNLVQSFLTPATPYREGVFQSMIVQGSWGAGDERALQTLDMALSEPAFSTANRGFIRPNADLAIVFLGDEDDHATRSPNIDPVALAAKVKRLKPGTDITVAAIVGLRAPPRCDPLTVGSWRIVSFANEFGSHAIKAICTSRYATTLSTISGAIVDARCTFDLERSVDFDRPVRVVVNGVRSQFVYHPDSGRYGAVEIVPCPQHGAIVAIAYDDECP